ncbi:hypothetical protein F5H01DRAFT_1091 [Linnemannia elongata]|nr:hypothetical protein F5H01DRAFT_1091 [Linnemannia elongata]
MTNLFLECENGHHTHRHVLCFCPLSLFFSLSPFPPPWTDGWPKDRFYCLLFSVFVRVFYGSYFFGLNIPLTKYFGDDGRGVCWLLVKHTYPQSGKKGTPTNNSTTATPAPTTNSTHTCSYTFSHIYIHTRNAPHHHIRHATHTRTHTHTYLFDHTDEVTLLCPGSMPLISPLYSLPFLYVPQSFLFSFVYHIRLIPTQLFPPFVAITSEASDTTITRAQKKKK